MDARIEDNWVELPTPEFALAASHPAIPVHGGRLGIHFGRMGIALSNAVPHGISHANSLLLGQTTRRSSTIGTARDNWADVLVPEKKGLRTHSALAFAPNPGSPPSEAVSLPAERPTVSKTKWHALFADDGVVQHYGSEKAPGQLSANVTRAHSDSAYGSPRTPTGPQRASTCPFPSSSNRESIFDSQYVFVDARDSGLFDSPLPFGSGFNPPQDDERIPTIIEGVSNFCDIVDRQYTQGSNETNVSSADDYYSAEALDFPTGVHQDSTDVYYTPTSNEFPSEEVERKLLVIGSNYDCKRASTFVYRQSLRSLQGAHLDAKSLKSAFRKRTYSVQTLVGNQFDRGTVLEKVASFLRSAKKPGDVRAIIFTGHARRMYQGAVALVPPLCRDEGDLIPADLWEKTVRENTEPGVIVLSIFASCMSGGLMRQRVDLKDLSSFSPPDEKASPKTPIFVTFASSEEHQLSYESTVSLNEDGTPRTGDHFLRALTLAARERNVTDWQSFIETIQRKFDQLRLIGAYCAELGSGSDVTHESWLERSPQQPVISASQLHLPPFQSVFPSEISLVEAPTTPVDPPTNLAEEFLAHIRLRGDFPEISHYTLSSTSNMAYWLDICRIFGALCIIVLKVQICGHFYDTLSDRDLSYSPPPTSKKRKSSTSNAAKPKRAKTQPDPFANAKESIWNALALPGSFALPKDEAGMRDLVLSIAEYAKTLEGSVAVAGTSGQPGPPPKTPEQIASEAARIADMVNRGIKKQMSWKPNCKTGRATYAFDGVCSDPRVFGAMLKLDGPPTLKAKKYTVDEFEKMVGYVRASVRYSYLGLTSDVNVRWDAETGEFKIGGKYGV
ncbi:hypothetical protein FRC10_010026 [Ceratobasidium sp. 414]|nr:hypothetical protein FRC10_010026 [Ceratobasidium sp. 414]